MNRRRVRGRGFIVAHAPCMAALSTPCELIGTLRLLDPHAPARSYRLLTRATGALGQAWTTRLAYAACRQASWLIVDRLDFLKSEAQSAHLHRPRGRPYSTEVQQRRRPRTTSTSRRRTAICPNDRQRPRCHEFASRGSVLKPLSSTWPWDRRAGSGTSPDVGCAFAL